ncbi:MAG: glutathione S-transferase N-terminal domain-containing protein [Deltaproteobacteria bacterium]|nr:glutathione S-transferase N-terminal domain-containing protein [Deltaproteobacteria bacterium]MBI3296503.1 glutathione S-transferase N-terminal domain-containing protein [Deltaproteobacteria bacterium]
MKIELLHTVGSNCAQRVLWALQYKKIPHTRIDFDHLSEAEILRVSPFGKVPAISVDGRGLAESMAIVEFLDEAFPEKPLLPKDMFQRGKVREVALLVDGTIHAVQNSKVSKFFHPEATKDEVFSYRAKWITRWLPKLEPLLFHNSEWAIGSSFSMADIFIVPLFVKGLFVGVELAQFPRFKRYLAHCASNADAWSCAPTELRISVAKTLS